MSEMLFKLFIITNAIFILYLDATLTPKLRKNNEKVVTDQNVLVGPQNYTVFDKNLVIERLSSKDIIFNHGGFFKEVDEYNFEGLILGYVTPWNGRGYDIAKIFGNKFTHISPVWLQIKRTGTLKYEVRGTHDIDLNWMTDVWNAGRERGVKIVPRILFDNWSGKDFVELFTTEEEVKALTDTLLKACDKWMFDGIVLEVWMQFDSRRQYDLLTKFLITVGTNLRDKRLDLILVVPPSGVLFTQGHFETLYDHVTAFSLMTYDYSGLHQPGPNAPLWWIEDCIKTICPEKKKRHKILAGINFYGNIFTPTGGGPIVGHEYIKKIKLFKGKLQYDPKSAENYFEIKESSGKSIIFYPTPYSINKRIELATEMGTGLSVWELGQGLDFFYDLL